MLTEVRARVEERAVLVPRAGDDVPPAVGHITERVDGRQRGHRVTLQRLGPAAQAARHRTAATEQLADRGPGTDAHPPLAHRRRTGRLAGRAPHLGVGAPIGPAGTQIEDHRGRHDRHPRHVGLEAAAPLLEPPRHAVGGGEPVGRAAGQQHGIDEWNDVVG